MIVMPWSDPPPPTTDSAVKKTRQLVFIVDVKANKHCIKPTVKKLCDIDVAKVSILIRLDGEKVCVQLALHCEALDVSAELGSSKLNPAG